MNGNIKVSARVNYPQELRRHLKVRDWSPSSFGLSASEWDNNKSFERPGKKRPPLNSSHFCNYQPVFCIEILSTRLQPCRCNSQNSGSAFIPYYYVKQTKRDLSNAKNMGMTALGLQVEGSRARILRPYRLPRNNRLVELIDSQHFMWKLKVPFLHGLTRIWKPCNGMLQKWKKHLRTSKDRRKFFGLTQRFHRLIRPLVGFLRLFLQFCPHCVNMPRNFRIQGSSNFLWYGSALLASKALFFLPLFWFR